MFIKSMSFNIQCRGILFTAKNGVALPTHYFIDKNL